MMINKRLISICEESKKYMFLTLLCSWIGIICNIAIIFMMGLFINAMVAGETLSKGLSHFYLTKHLTLAVAIPLIIILLIAKFIAHHYYGKFSYKSSAKARSTLRSLIYEKLLRLGMDYQKSQPTSTIVQISIEGVEQLEIYFGKYLPQFFYSLLAPLTLFVVISTISWKVALVFIACVPLIPISIIALMKVAKRIMKDYWNNYADLGDTFLENLQGLTTLKVYGQDDIKHLEMNEEAEKFRRITMKLLSMQLNSINIMDLIAFGGSALGTIVALYQFQKGAINVGELIVIILLSSEFFIPMRLLGSYFHIAMNGMAASDRIFALLDTEEVAVKNPCDFKKDSSVKIEVENINFSYDGERQVLNDISFDLTNGGLTAIVGESGSGKSTMATLLIGQKRPTSGRILINGVDLTQLKTEALYEHVSLVSAHSHIFKGSIKENLLMAKRDATSEEVNQALKMARLDQFIAGLPKGLETEVSENGSSLSGGQKQRLALARVILANRDVIIFDEATSNIDVESEEAIWDAIYELSQQKTILVISHRLASVKRAKAIHVFKLGTLVESGTHDHLMSQNGVYAHMVESQQQLEMIREVE
ncbi:ABC transporter ATP-binding protein/permease [Turicibacter sanguinis]|jgi:ABC transporter, ATP-binding protein|uniref:ATP-binding cassette domain-containing protein n=3 Tax=Turicibacter sanguinis TaxID=154288 RepID=A0A6A8SDD1_9FIRM|nr:ABC transporter ATP-binding protein/permease [Turicibacter sanguinis]EFF64915.1 ABC transporter, ATP-binding protein [Turicibacter sanguinis PC909]MDB8542968.1 ABC transporter ATP-binding protein/permease [Turicibacter sanguinis]MDB8555433.1 ABC transporter ATP-binding protein/permease [Turicibacter sanguinis]MDB8558007.1 ABC transporter ATP-binding protein/permease [Turicibacter sanguinis]MDB8560782.1 ABC transporter ATP-binding protein/permease [Turicibacter sanguinis]